MRSAGRAAGFDALRPLPHPGLQTDESVCFGSAAFCDNGQYLVVCPGPLSPDRPIGPPAKAAKSWADLDGSKEPPEPKGVLQSIVATVLMKFLYGARMARDDLLKAIQLATQATKWTTSNDRQLLSLCLLCPQHALHAHAGVLQ